MINKVQSTFHFQKNSLKLNTLFLVENMLFFVFLKHILLKKRQINEIIVHENVMKRHSFVRPCA